MRLDGRPTQTLSGLRLQKDSDAFFPGLPKLNPGLKLANAFSVINYAPKVLRSKVECWAGRYPFFRVASSKRFGCVFPEVTKAQQCGNALPYR
jgi:hypothetical protein